MVQGSYATLEESKDMAVKVRVSGVLRKLVDGASEVSADGGTVKEMIDALERDHPGFHERLYDEGGELRRFVNVYVSNEDIRFLKGLDTPLKDGEEISIVPAVAGG
jgi:sulfur-carrier protein